MKTRCKLLTITLLTGLLGFMGNANAVLLFSDNFAESDITSQHNNFSTLDNWDVADGTVDAYVNGGFGLPCLSGGCLDMDGSTNNSGRIQSKNTFNFLANVSYTLTVEYHGNARNGGDDNLIFGFLNNASVIYTGIASNDNWTTRTMSILRSANWSSKLFLITHNLQPVLETDTASAACASRHTRGVRSCRPSGNVG